MILFLKKDTSEKELLNHIELRIWIITKFAHVNLWKSDFGPSSRRFANIRLWWSPWEFWVTNANFRINKSFMTFNYAYEILVPLKLTGKLLMILWDHHTSCVALWHEWIWSEEYHPHFGLSFQTCKQHSNSASQYHQQELAAKLFQSVNYPINMPN